jgi:hypothetical protein
VRSLLFSEIANQSSASFLPFSSSWRHCLLCSISPLLRRWCSPPRPPHCARLRPAPRVELLFLPPPSVPALAVSPPSTSGRGPDGRHAALANPPAPPPHSVPDRALPLILLPVEPRVPFKTQPCSSFCEFSPSSSRRSTAPKHRRSIAAGNSPYPHSPTPIPLAQSLPTSSPCPAT